MAYHEISIMDIWEVIRRWHDRQAISQIARTLDYDRKTVRGYIHQAQRLGWSPELPLPAKDEVLRLLQQAGPTGATPGLCRTVCPDALSR